MLCTCTHVLSSHNSRHGVCRKLACPCSTFTPRPVAATARVAEAAGLPTGLRPAVPAAS